MNNVLVIFVLCYEINELELDVDWMLCEVMFKVFCEELDVCQVIKFKEIYEFFELVIDCCKDVVGMIEVIVFENF